MALEQAGIRLTLEGAAEYKAGLQGIAQATRLANTESKLAVAQLGSNAKASDIYKTRVNALGKEMQLASEKTKTLSDRQKNLPKQQESIAKAIQETTRAYEDSGKETKRLKQNYDQMRQSLGSNHEETKKARAEWQTSKETTRELGKEVDALNKAYRANEQELSKLPNELAKAELATQRYRNELQRLHTEHRNQGGWARDFADAMQESGKKVQAFAQPIKELGGTLTKSLTVPMLALGGIAIKAASDWETAMAGVRKTNDDLVDSNGNVVYSVDEIESGLRKMATTMPVAAAELAGIAENAGQLGIQADSVLEFTEVMAKLSETTNLTADSASTAFAQFMNVMGTSQTEVKNLANTLVDLGNNSATTEADIMSMAQRLSSYASIAGVSESDTLALASALSSVGIQAEAGGSAMGKAIDTMNSAVKSGGTELSTFAQVAGMSAKEFTSAWEDRPMNAISAFIQGLGDMIAEGKDVNPVLDELGLSGLRTSMSLRSLAQAGDLLPDSMNRASKAYAVHRDELGALDEEYAVFSQTFGAKLQRMQNRLMSIAIDIGGPLVDAITAALEAMDPWIQKVADAARAFAEMDEEGQRNILMWAGIAAAIGPVLSVIGTVIDLFGKGQHAIGTFARALGKITTPKAIGETADELAKVPGSATLAGKAATLFSNPWVTAGAAAIAGIGGFIWYMNNEANAPFRAHDTAVANTKGKYQEWFDAMIDGQEAINAFHEASRDSADESTRTYEELAQQIRNTNKEVQDYISTLTTKSKPLLGSLAQVIEVDGQKISVVVESVTDKLKALGKTDQEIEQLTGAMQNYGTMLSNSFRLIADDFKNGVTMTEDWANAHISVVNDIADETIGRLDEMRQAELESNAERRANLGETTEWLEEQNRKTNESYNQLAQGVRNAQETIRSILANAKDDVGNWRQLTEIEVLSLLEAYSTLAEGTGRSLHSMGEVGDLITNNMGAMVTDMGLDFLKSAGFIDQATLEMVASAGTAEEKIKILSEALKDFDTINVDAKKVDLDVNGEAELMELEELLARWNDLSVAEKSAQVATRGEEELAAISAMLGVDWNGLQPEQKEAVVNATGGERLEELYYQLGIWSSPEMTLEEKSAILKAQIDSEALAYGIEAAGLWSNATFVSKFAQIDTNAPNARQDIVNLVNELRQAQGLPPLQIETNTNAEETADEIGKIGGAADGIDGRSIVVNVGENGVETVKGGIDAVSRAIEETDGGTVTVYTYADGALVATEQLTEFDLAQRGLYDKSVTVNTSAPEAAENASAVEQFAQSANAVPEEKRSSIATNILSTIANTHAVKAYNSAVSDMEDKSVSAETSTSGMTDNTSNIKDYNTNSGEMKDTKATATTNTPNLPKNTELVASWNETTNSMRDKTSTATTLTPSIGSNTRSVWNWISALNASYSKTSTLTTYVDRVYRTFGRHAEGGHIDAYADGGNIKWGGMFAGGGNVPRGYMGIVGEAGPELFHVTRSGVSITPLAPGEKMRGVEGAIEDFMKGKQMDSNGNGSINVNVNLSNITIRDDRDIDTLASEIGKRIAKATERESIMRKGRAVGHA